MIIDCISDLHGYKPMLLGGDLLIVAGDLTARDKITEHLGFSGWLCNQPYDKIVLIAGNHDGKMLDWKPFDQNKLSYLQDSGTEYKGLKIWGSPWTPTFCDWHFMKARGAVIKEMWDKIPMDTDILVTHGPPFGILDKVNNDFAGCEELRTAIERVKPRLHVFGHIHAGYGQMTLKCTPTDVLCVNAAIMNEQYQPVNKPIRIIL